MLNSSLIGYTVLYNILYVFREIQNSLLKQFWNHLHFSQSINRRVIVNISECLIHIKSAVWLTISKNKIEIKKQKWNFSQPSSQLPLHQLQSHTIQKLVALAVLEASHVVLHAASHTAPPMLTFKQKSPNLSKSSK